MVKCSTIKVLFLYLKLYLSVMSKCLKSNVTNGLKKYNGICLNHTPLGPAFVLGEKTGVRCIQVKLTEISYIRTLFYKVWFIQNSVLFRVGFKQFSLYHILRWTNFIKYKISLIYLIRIIPRSWSSIG